MKGLVVRNSKRRKASREDKEFFLGSLLALPSMNSEVFAFPPTMIWGRHQDRPSQKLAGFSLGKKMKETTCFSSSCSSSSWPFCPQSEPGRIHPVTAIHRTPWGCTALQGVDGSDDDGDGGSNDSDDWVTKARECIHLGLHWSHARCQGKLGLDFLCK